MISYAVSIPNPESHFIDIKISIDKIKHPVTQLFLPAWRPGRYELGNFSKNIRYWKALDKDGNELPFKKITKDCWEIETGKQTEITITYQYFANILNAGACWLDHTQLYINGIHCFMYDKNRIEEPCELKLNIPASWKIACGLQQKSKHLLVANDFHQLVDCPLVASPSLQHGRYDIGKITFHIWFQGECKPDWDRLIKDFKHFSTEQLRLFEGFPVKDYHFIIQILPFSYYHGVEHTNSTVLVLGPGYDLMQANLYHELLGVACHELFHTWNIKTIRPDDMLPYNYQVENYSRLGYIYEGVTTYYGDYLLGRCGIFTDEEFLAEMSTRLQSHMDNAGRFNYSVSESSFDTWLDGYVPGIPGRKTSIYDEGCLVALMLDLMIRKDTANKKTADDFLRALNEVFGSLEKGYTEKDLTGLLKYLTGKSYEKFFDNLINKPVSYEKELQKILAYVGCELTQTPAIKNYEHHFGFKILTEGGLTRISKIYPGSVADQAGLFIDDEIVSVNGFRVENNLEQWFRYFTNENITLEVFSNKQSKRISLKLKNDKYFSKWKIARSSKASKANLENFEKWLGR